MGSVFSGSGVGGELVIDQQPTFTLVSGDVNGDGLADFAIALQGPVSLTALGFVL